MSTPSEPLSILAVRAREGDRSAWAELYRATSKRVWGLCRHLLGSAEEADDAAGSVFLKLSQALEQYDPALPFDRWLLRVAGNHCLDRLRRRRLERSWIAEQEDSFADDCKTGEAALAPDTRSPSPLAQLLLEERRAEVEAALERLPPAYRFPLVLRYYGELGYEEIARELGIETPQVAGRIFRAKKMLRRMLEPDRGLSQ